MFTYKSVNENISDLLALILSMARSNEESRLKGQRNKDAYASMRKRREIASGRAPSWLKIERDPVTGAKRFVLIPERVEVIRRMFELAASGVSPYAIARIFNNEGILPPSYSTHQKVTGVRKWSRTVIYATLKGRRVLGDYEPNVTSFEEETGKRILTPIRTMHNYYPQIISDDLYAQAQHALKIRSQTQIRGNTGEEFSNLLKDMAVCAECGCTMRMKRSQDMRHKYPKRASASPYGFFRCSGREDGVCDNTKTPRYDALESTVLRLVEEVDLADTRDAEAAEIEGLIATAQRRHDTLIDEVRDIIENAGFLKTAMKIAAEKEAEAEKLEQAIKKDQERLAAIQSAQRPADRRAAMRGLRERLERASTHERFQIRAALNAKMREIIDRVAFHKDGSILAHIVDGRGIVHGRGNSPYPYKRYRLNGPYTGAQFRAGTGWTPPKAA